MLPPLPRHTILQDLSDTTYDLIVIGGGATGAGVALDAASRGLKVILLEKDDFASGTSSRSTKLIHGGLRYLKQLDFGLVREVGMERSIVHKLAPHLVIPEKMLIPLVEGGTFGRWSTSFGLWFYDLLASVAPPEKRKMLSREETYEKEPLLQPPGLKGSGFYAEYRTDDARLTLALIKTAAGFGAHCLNYARVTQLGEAITGKDRQLRFRDELTGEHYESRAVAVVNAAGPWADQVRSLDGPVQGKQLFLSKGIHIVFPRERFPISHSVYFELEDGRMIFAIPRQQATYVGTTDTAYQGPLDRIRIYREEVDYLLDGVHAVFPGLNIAAKDVISGWAGLRPLIHEPGKEAREMSRKDELFFSGSGLITIAGGKLTGYRKMARKVVDFALEKFGEAFSAEASPCQTDRIALWGGPFSDYAGVGTFVQSLAARLKSFGWNDPVLATYLVQNYGRKSDAILDRLSASKGQLEEAQLIRAELEFSMAEEFVCKPMDFLSRRTGMLFFDPARFLRSRELVLSHMADALNWSARRVAVERKAIEQEYELVTQFPEKAD